MSAGVTAAGVLTAVAGIASVATLMTKPNGGVQRQPGEPMEIEKPPQASKTPEVGALRRQNAAAEGGPGMSSSSTLLTGPAGVDASLLNLGRSTLLGQ